MSPLKTFLEQFDTCRWKPAGGVERLFVKHRALDPSPGFFCVIPFAGSRPLLSVVIPTGDADRGGYFKSLLRQIECQTYPLFEVIVVKEDGRQGRAINAAAALARGDYLLTLDDDTALPEPTTFERLVKIMEKWPDIGIAGGNNLIPPDAGPFVRKVMHQIPRRSWKPVTEITDSDLAEHPCMIMRVSEFKCLGGENELIPRGLDPYLRQKFRKAGLRVVVVPNVYYYHLPPASIEKLLLQFFRNGKDAAFTHYYFPQWEIETPSHHGLFKERVSPIFRYSRFAFRLAAALLKGRVYLFIAEIAYALGYSYCKFHLKRGR